MRDTSAAAELVRFIAIRAMTPAERLRQAFDLSETARQLAIVGLRQRYPDLSDVELVELYAGHRILPDVARRARP